ncbi:MAG: hypothetical protein ACK5PB_22275 [Pirellula sp.]|jgi:hypothetical protein
MAKRKAAPSPIDLDDDAFDAFLQKNHVTYHSEPPNRFGWVLSEEGHRLTIERAKKKFGPIKDSRTVNTEPVFPLRAGYAGVAPPEVVDAVRKVIADWDGTNWDTVRHTIELTRQDSESKPLADWTLDDVRQRFAIGQKAIVIKLGGVARTTECTVSPPLWAEVDNGSSNLTEAKTNRKKGGRPPAKLSKDDRDAKTLWESGGFTSHNDIDEKKGWAWGTTKKILNKIAQQERRKKMTKRTE